MILNPSNSSITCDQTHYCVLWVGVDYNTNFGDASSTAFSSSFLINPAVAPTITSANNATFPKGHTTTFTVTTTGTPTANSITESGALPSGVTFTNNGNGTATLTGNPATAENFPLQITASNGTARTRSRASTCTPGS